jgi:transposase
MIQVEEIERIRRAYFIEGQSIRAIARHYRHGRRVVRRAIAQADPPRYQLQTPKAAPVVGPYQARIDALLAESERQPRKQRYTARKIFHLVQDEGYAGSESTVRRYVSVQRQAHRKPDVFLPLEFDPGQDAQVDWGAAQVVVDGEQVTAQVFVMRLNYSKARFAIAYPHQQQEAFLDAHIQAFHFFGGVPHRITYDNLKTAVYSLGEGHQRQEQHTFITFRSHYLFESHFCTPGQAHEKGGVELDIGYVRRNFLVPVPRVAGWAELNQQLGESCLRDTARQLRGEPATIAAMWDMEKAALLPLPAHDYPPCSCHPVKADAYSLVTFQTNQYSVPVAYAGKQLVLQAYPFHVRVLALDQVVAEHPRCFQREQTVYDPLHYLPLLVQRPGAFEHAAPLRRWRSQWPPAYETLLAELQARHPDGQGLREFLTILKLHRDYPAEWVDQAVQQALALGAAHLDGVQLCLRQQTHPTSPAATLDLSEYPHLRQVGHYAVNLAQYDQLRNR